ncbi:hypothetical protein [Legionella hackeliae]|uniref:Uncharacterized protein n=1 Tax=Legionella hackeliae TaxID=449 RepID=A0A0A8UTN3_LEGHA|nr:hypothetical protein [Legionella hackeliae]KTD12667.1 hypothetical protein Lhac_1538 [Legionella hackeliae]CEK12083.1 protein of unknown function [Legionella hackeliae]STX48872.1 Uncharacterised protein [Legionella hackeliae]
MPGLEDAPDLMNTESSGSSYQSNQDDDKKPQAKQEAPKPKPKPTSDGKKEETTNDLQMKMVEQLKDLVSSTNNMLYGKFYDELEKSLKEGFQSGFGLKKQGKGKSTSDDGPDEAQDKDDIEDMEFGDDIESLYDDDDDLDTSFDGGSGPGGGSSGDNTHDDVEDMEFGDDIESVFDDSPMESMSMDSVSSPGGSSDGLQSMDGLSGGGGEGVSQVTEVVADNPEILAAL